MNRLAVTLAATALAASWATTAVATTIEVDKAWCRATPPGVTVGAAYMSIDNRGRRSDRLLSVSSSRAARVEVHATVHEQDTVKMRRVDPLHLAAGERLALEPGGMHMMLMGLDAPLKAGEEVPLTLQFELAGEVRVTARVFAPTDAAAAEDHSHHHH
jgi:periplasmic copper chaperone A